MLNRVGRYRLVQLKTLIKLCIEYILVEQCDNQIGGSLIGNAI